MAKPQILIVEDDPFVRMVGVDIATDYGFEVIEAGDADAAMNLLEQTNQIVLVFTDIQMPGSMDGLALVAAISNRWPPVALIVTSGRIRPSADELPAGALFLPKPYSSSELQDHFRRLTHSLH